MDKYRTIVVDPPWPITMAGNPKCRPNQAKRLPYETMTIEQIKALPIRNIAEIGCHVYCWTTNKMLDCTFDIFREWGVNFHQVLVSIKHNGMCPCFGYKFATEFCLLGFCGKPMFKFVKAGELNWIYTNMKKNHSQKPDEFYQLFEKMSPAPRIDLFARPYSLSAQNRPGWDVWGDEVVSSIDMDSYKKQKIRVVFPKAIKVSNTRQGC